MNTNSRLNSVKEILIFSMQDPEWKMKYLIGSGLIFAGTIIPVLPWLPVMGYGARVLRRSADSADSAESPGLPAWDDWTDLFVDGLRQFGVSFLLSLPLILLMVMGYGLYFSSFIFMTADGGDPPPFVFFSFAILWLSIGLSILMSLVTMLLMAPALAHVAVRQDFSTFLKVREWWAVLRSNLGGFLVVLFILLGLYTSMMFAVQLIYLTIILCCFLPVLIAPMGFYLLLTFYHTTGLAYAEDARLYRGSDEGAELALASESGDVDVSPSI